MKTLSTTTAGQGWSNYLKVAWRRASRIWRVKKRIDWSIEALPNQTPVQKFVNLVFFQAIQDKAEQMVFAQHALPNGSTQFQIKVSRGCENWEMHEPPAFLFEHVVQYILEILQPVDDSRNCDGILKTFNFPDKQDTQWLVHWYPEEKRLVLQRNPSDSIDDAGPTRKSKFGRAIITDDPEQVILRLLRLIVSQARAEKVDRMTFRLGTDKNGKEEWQVRTVGPKGEEKQIPKPASWFKPAVEILLGQVLEQVSERDGVTEGILMTYQPDSKWNVRYNAATQEVLLERVREGMPAGK